MVFIYIISYKANDFLPILTKRVRDFGAVLHEIFPALEKCGDFLL